MPAVLKIFQSYFHQSFDLIFFIIFFQAGYGGNSYGSGGSGGYGGGGYGKGKKNIFYTIF